MCKLLPEYRYEPGIALAGGFDRRAALDDSCAITLHLCADALQQISKKSCDVLTEMGPSIQWVQSYLGKDAIYCVYIAPDEGMVREHASQGGFPANSISKVTSVIAPTSTGVVKAFDAPCRMRRARRKPSAVFV